jgi:hypothetical protein
MTRRHIRAHLEFRANIEHMRIYAGLVFELRNQPSLERVEALVGAIHLSASPAHDCCPFRSIGAYTGTIESVGFSGDAHNVWISWFGGRGCR